MFGLYLGVLVWLQRSTSEYNLLFLAYIRQRFVRPFFSVEVWCFLKGRIGDRSDVSKKCTCSLTHLGNLFGKIKYENTIK